MSTLDDLLPAAEAARLLAPHLPGRDASAWLKDMRRSAPEYRARVRPPEFERKGRRVYYRRGEILDLIDRLGTVAHARPHHPAGRKSAPGLVLDYPPIVADVRRTAHGNAVVDLLLFPHGWASITSHDARALARELEAAAARADGLTMARAA